ncbi:MAG: hypothetical protein R3F43_12050 [bacterium]
MILAIAIAATVAAFWRVRRLAGGCCCPTCSRASPRPWNFAIWRLN